MLKLKGKENVAFYTQGGLKLKNWTIKVLFFGKINGPKANATPGIDADLVMDFPYLGWLLQDGQQNVLVDTGISEKFIVDGKAWGNLPAKGGRSYVEAALVKEKVKPEDISMVLYTHLHNDHAGSCDLFPKARHITQRDEWKELLDPLPSMKIRKDYDPGLIPVLAGINLEKIDGDIDIADGIKLMKTPGHTKGSQTVGVNTAKGLYYIVGDIFLLTHNAFPYMKEITDIYGKKAKITPAPEVYGPAIPTSIVYDHYAWYDSVYKVKALAGAPEFIIPGHEPSLVGKTFP